MPTSAAARRHPSALPDPLAGILAGLIAGTAYLLAQMAFAATVQGGTGWEPLQRISAMLLGPDVLPPPGEVDVTIGGMALLIHAGLAIVFGRLVDVAVRDRGVGAAALRGALIGVALYVLDYWIVAPLAFRWFEEVRGITTALDHVLFGAIAGAVYAVLRQRHQQSSGVVTGNIPEQASHDR